MYACKIFAFWEFINSTEILYRVFNLFFFIISHYTLLCSDGVYYLVKLKVKILGVIKYH